MSYVKKHNVNKSNLRAAVVGGVAVAHTCGAEQELKC